MGTQNNPNTGNHNKEEPNEGENEARRRGQHGKNSRYANQFKGETHRMQGKVFRLQSEQTKKGEFKDTMEALERYAGREYPLDTTKLQVLFKHFKPPFFEEPKVPGETEASDKIKTEEDHQPSEWDKIKYIEEYKMYLKNQERLTATLIALFNVVWGQCSRRMQDRLKVEKEYKSVHDSNDVATLLKLIKVVSHKFEANVCLNESLWEAKHKLFTYRQGDYESNSLHIRNIKYLFEVVEHLGGSIFDDDSLVKKAQKRFQHGNNSMKTKEEYEAMAHKRALALHALRTSKHKGVMKMLRDQFMLREDKYPNDLNEAYELLNRFITADSIPEVRGSTRKGKTEENTSDNVIKGVQYLMKYHHVMVIINIWFNKSY